MFAWGVLVGEAAIIIILQWWLKQQPTPLPAKNKRRARKTGRGKNQAAQQKVAAASGSAPKKQAAGDKQPAAEQAVPAQGGTDVGCGKQTIFGRIVDTFTPEGESEPERVVTRGPDGKLRVFVRSHERTVDGQMQFVEQHWRSQPGQRG